MAAATGVRHVSTHESLAILDQLKSGMAGTRLRISPPAIVVVEDRSRPITSQRRWYASASAVPRKRTDVPYMSESVLRKRTEIPFVSESDSSLRQRWMGESFGWRGFDEGGRWPEGRPCQVSGVEEASTSEELAAVIDGTAISADIKNAIKEEVEEMKSKVGKAPGLAVVLVGSRRDSQAYVRMKKKACEQTGIESFGVDFPEDASEEDVLKAVQKLNNDPRVHGVLVQLPLPKHMSEERVLAEVSLEKDVDGFHPLNMGRLAMAGREPLFAPCTPLGCIELLLRSGVNLDGKRAVVIGRSNVVGLPAALLLQRHNATVTVVHSHTADPAAVTREADIVIAAVGVANLVRGDWLKPGAVVIDVGINSVKDDTDKRGYRLVGDVCYEEARKVASAITPVPGGVGPMTIAMLLRNTLVSARRSYGLEDSS